MGRGTLQKQKGRYMDALHLKFVQVAEPVTALVTKFGGQPVWLESAAWPVSRSTGQPMVFVGQIRIPDFINPHGDLRMAYIFMTLDPDVDNTYDPNGGENSVIIQKADFQMQPVAAAQGPSLLFANFVSDKVNLLLPCEFLVECTLVDDGIYIAEAEFQDLPNDEYERIRDLWSYDKIGGNPHWYQNEEFPYAPAKLLLQLGDDGVPFFVNFGCGIAYVFTDESVQEAKMLWQC